MMCYRVILFAWVAVSVGLVHAAAVDGASPAPVASAVVQKKDPVLDRKANEARLLEIQSEITAIRQQDTQLRDAARKQYISLENSQSDVQTQDEEYLALKEQLKQADMRVLELRAQLKKKTDAMPEFKESAAKMADIQSKMRESSRKITELLKEKSRLNSEIFAAMQQGQPPVKAREVAPLPIALPTKPAAPAAP